MKQRIVPVLLLLVLCLGLVTPALAYDGMDTAGQKILSGYYHSAAIDENGTLWMWGHNGQSQLGRGEEGNAVTDSGLAIQTVPAQALDNVAAASCGGFHTAAIDENGALWMWGQNSSGQLGNGGQGNAESQRGKPIQTVPVKVMDNMAAVSCGAFHTAAIDQNGVLWAWGNNQQGQLGIGGDVETSDVPVKVMDNVVAVSCGQDYTAAIDTDGAVWTWGNNSLGQLGNGGTENAFTPVKVMENAVAVACGGYHTAAIDADGSLWLWGSNEYGQLGNQIHGIETAPVKVMENITAVSCGHAHTAAIDTDNALWTWGSNANGQLGNEGQGNATALSGPVQTVPVQVLSNVTAIACGELHTIAVRDDGSLWTWGSNNYGQLGDGSQDSAASPVFLSQPTMSQSGQPGQADPGQAEDNAPTQTDSTGTQAGTGTALIILAAVLVLLVAGGAVVLLRKKKTPKKKTSKR